MSINNTAGRYRPYFRPGSVREKILSNNSTRKNKTSLLGKVINGINSLHQNYNESKKQSSKKLIHYYKQLNKKISKRKIK